MGKNFMLERPPLFVIPLIAILGIFAIVIATTRIDVDAAGQASHAEYKTKTYSSCTSGGSGCANPQTTCTCSEASDSLDCACYEPGAHTLCSYMHCE